MEDLTNVIKTLLHLQGQISLAVETLNEIGDNYKTLREMKVKNHFSKITLESATHTLISNHAIILFCSFLDEYEKNFTPHFLKNIDAQRIINVRKKNEPGLKRIRKWKDLRNFRNFLVAHNFRNKGKSFFSDEFDKFKFIIPNKVSEKNLFSGIIYCVCINIRTEFPEIFYSLNIKEVMLDKIEFICEEVESEKELTELISKMQI